jgi:hypothetical protein
MHLSLHRWLLKSLEPGTLVCAIGEANRLYSLVESDGLKVGVFNTQSSFIQRNNPDFHVFPVDFNPETQNFDLQAFKHELANLNRDKVKACLIDGVGFRIGDDLQLLHEYNYLLGFVKHWILRTSAYGPKQDQVKKNAQVWYGRDTQNIHDPSFGEYQTLILTNPNLV